MDRLSREFGVQANTGTPQVAYKETLLKAAAGEGEYVRAAGGKNQYGQGRLRPRAAPPGRRASTSSTRPEAGELPTEFVGAVEDGVRESLDFGTLAGFPMTDVKATLTGGGLERDRFDARRLQDRRHAWPSRTRRPRPSPSCSSRS